MDVVSSVSSATVQSDMNSSPYDTSEHGQSVFKSPDSHLIIPCNKPLSEKTDLNESHMLNSQLSSPPDTSSPLSDPFISSTSNDRDNEFVFPNSQDFTTVSCAPHTVPSTIENYENRPGLDQLLTCSVSTHMIPRMGSPQDSLISSPVNDTVLSSPGGNTAMESANPEYTLIDQADRFNLNDHETNNFEGVHFVQESENGHGFEQLLDYVTESDSHKVPKVRRDSDAPTSLNKEEVTVEKLFEADLANSTTEFSFNKFGSEVSQGIFTFGGQNLSGADTLSTNSTLVVTTPLSVPSASKHCEIVKSSVTPVTRSQRGRQTKEASLCTQYPSRTDKYELRILEQPEEQHRARYLTEGSRGAIKNVSQEGNPSVKLLGDVDHATLQVFIGSDSGRVKPHAFYQACKVSGKNSTPCQEREIEGTVVIEMEMDAVNDKTSSIDNVGILKLRNADVENRVGIQKAKKKSTKARLIFRVQFQKPDGNFQILQIASRSINCTQPIGQPEICKMSMRESSVSGNGELIMIGKNFMKGTKVFFQETQGEDGPVLWEKEAEIDKDYFQPTHLVCVVPPYVDPCVGKKVDARVVVKCSGKQSDPQSFAYTPVLQIKQESTPMETDEQVQKPGSLTITVAPEALRLNQQLQESLASSHGKFLLPDGTVSGITSMQVDETNNLEDKQGKESETYQSISPNSMAVNGNPQNTLNSQEQHVFQKDSNVHAEQHEHVFQGDTNFQTEPVFQQDSNVTEENHGFQQETNVHEGRLQDGHLSLAKDSVEPIQMNTSDLHSFLKSLDDKPITLQEILTQNPSETMAKSASQTQMQTSYPDGTNGGRASVGFSPIIDNHKPVELATTFTAHEINGQQQINSPSLGNGNQAGFGNSGHELNTNNHGQQIIHSEPKTTEFSHNLQGYDQANALSSQNQTFLMLKIPNSQHQFVNSPNNSQNIQSFNGNINNQQTQQLHVMSPQQQNLQNFQNVGNFNVGNIGQLPNGGNFETQQQNVSQQQNMEQDSQANVMNIPTESVGNVQTHQQNIGNMPTFQQNIGNIQQQQHQFPTSPNNTIGNAYQLQGYTSEANGQSLNLNKNIQSNVLTGGFVPVSPPVSSSAGQSSNGYSDTAMRFLQQLLTTQSSSQNNPTSFQAVGNLQGQKNALYTSATGNLGVGSPGTPTNLLQLNLPTSALQNQPVSSVSSQPKVQTQTQSQSILHHMLSKDFDEKILDTKSSLFPGDNQSVKPDVHQLDSLRLQAMAQQVQQQAQQAQQARVPSNGSGAKGPQIIVLGGTGGTDQQSNLSSAPSAAAAPSILILPGAGDNNNTQTNPQSQVEFILRSILGSLKPNSS